MANGEWEQPDGGVRRLHLEEKRGGGAPVTEEEILCDHEHEGSSRNSPGWLVEVEEGRSGLAPCTMGGAASSTRRWCDGATELGWMMGEDPWGSRGAPCSGNRRGPHR